MIDFKFRAWNKIDKEMVKIIAINFDMGKIAYDGEKSWDTYLDSNSMDLKDFVLMQSSGIEDINGVKIYERDIVMYHTPYFKRICQVEFHDGHFMIVDEVRSGHEDLWKAINNGYVEVIGNRYENPTLYEPPKKPPIKEA